MRHLTKPLCLLLLGLGCLTSFAREYEGSRANSILLNLVAVRGGDAQKVLLVDGSYLRTAQGNVVLECFSKCHAVVVRRTGGSGVDEVYVQCAAGSDVRIASDEVPRRMTINGRQIAGETAVRRGGMLEFPPMARSIPPPGPPGSPITSPKPFSTSISVTRGRSLASADPVPLSDRLPVRFNAVRRPAT